MQEQSLQMRRWVQADKKTECRQALWKDGELLFFTSCQGPHSQRVAHLSSSQCDLTAALHG